MMHFLSFFDYFSTSSVFDYEDDALVLEILSRKKNEAEMISNRTVVRGDGRA